MSIPQTLRSLRPFAGACLAGALALGATAAVGDNSEEGYWVNSYGEVIKTQFGECWRTGHEAEGDQSEYARECGDAEAAEEEVAESDSDGDGVVDSRDACPDTPAGRTVDESGCQLDSDGDGVVDARDRCQGTPSGTDVDAGGCKIDANINVTLSGDEFAFDDAEVPASMKSKLNELVRRIRSTPGNEKLVIVGHTDSVGSADYNQDLSQRRAQSVADHLYERGIDRFAMEVIGKGESDPASSNDTAEGRADNRRVVVTTE